MMWFKLIGLTATLTVGAYTAHEVVEALLPQATEAGAQQTFVNITDAAYYDSVLSADTWPELLKKTVLEARKNEQVTVDGTTLYWRAEGVCFKADVPTPDTTPVAVACEEGFDE